MNPDPEMPANPSNASNHGSSAAIAATKTSGKAIFAFVCGLGSLLCSFLATLPAILFGVLALRDIGKSNGRVAGKGLAIAGIACSLILPLILMPIQFAVLLPAVQAARNATRITASKNNMKMISLAMMNHDMSNGRYPGAGSQLSWRVHLLPYMEQAGLYEQFHLDEPWDSEHNKALIPLMPSVLASPRFELLAGMTVYQVPVGNGAAFDINSDQGPSIADLKDGPSNTAVLLEVSPQQAVEWTKPDDWEFDPLNPKQGLYDEELGRKGFLAGMGDGAVFQLSEAILAEAVAAMITREGGEIQSTLP